MRTLIFTAALMTAGCATPQAQREAGVYTLAGKGSPTVVLQSGLGDDRSTWSDILPALSAHYTVFALDRPGTGNNPAAAGPRDPCTIAAEQRTALRAAGLQPPYVLVGHSLGGLYQYAYAALYPEDVAGFVLLDPTHPRNWTEIQRQLPVAAMMLRGIKKTAFSDSERREFDEQMSCLDRPEFASPLRMPGRVLVAGRPRASDPEGYEALHMALAREWPALAGTPGIDIVWDSAHYLHKERPQRVIAAIRQIASPGECSEGCADGGRSLVADLGEHPPFTIVFGESRRAELELALGPAQKAYSNYDSSGSEVRSYHHKPEKPPAALSYIPFLGDILDAADLIQDMREWRELVVEYDAAGVVKWAGIRRIQ